MSDNRIIKCLTCKKEFKCFPYEIKRGRKFCSRLCQATYGLGQFKKGSIPPNKGIKLKDWMDPYKNKERKIKISKTLKGIVRSYETKIKIRNAQCGEKSVHWKGGRKGLLYALRNSFYYKIWRESVFKRDNYTCQKCGLKSCWIEAHHKIYFSKILDDNNIKNIEQALKCEALWNIDNGITLCEDCHYKIGHKGKHKFEVKP